MLEAILGGAVIADGVRQPPVIRSQSVLPNLGNPAPLHLKYAEQLRESLPASLKDAIHEPLAATALLYAMLLAPTEQLSRPAISGDRSPHLAADCGNDTGVIS